MPADHQPDVRGVADSSPPVVGFDLIMDAQKNQAFSKGSPLKLQEDIDLDSLIVSGKYIQHDSGGSRRDVVSGLDSDDEGTPPLLHEEPQDLLDRPIAGTRPTIGDFPESSQQRPTADKASCKLEALDKIRIFVIAHGATTAVSWHRDTPPSEVQRAVLCACDCIHDGGVQLRELQTFRDDAELQQLIAAKQHELGGKLVKVTVDGEDKWFKKGITLEFEEFGDALKHDQLYELIPARDRLELETITGDHSRRILLQVPALTHVEAQQAVKIMRTGSNLIKKTRIDGKHFRFFQLSPDLRRLLWYSGKKYSDETTLNLGDVVEIKVSHFDTPVSNKTSGGDGLEFYRQCSFTVVTHKRVLELCAKDEAEFDIWVTGLKALAAHFRDVKINKVQLLGHSRAFRRELRSAKLLHEDSGNVDETPSASIHQFLNTSVKTRAEAVKLLEVLENMLRALRQRAAPIDYSTLKSSPANASASVETQPTPANLTEADEVAMTDEQVEFRQAQAFLNESEEELKKIRVLLDEHQRRGLATPQGLSNEENERSIEAIARRLWEVNINIENTADILVRLSDSGMQPTMVNTLSAIHRQIEEGKERIAKGWAQFTSAIVTPAVQKLKAFALDEPEHANDMVEPPISPGHQEHNNVVMENTNA